MPMSMNAISMNISQFLGYLICMALLLKSFKLLEFINYVIYAIWHKILKKLPRLTAYILHFN